MIKFVLCFMAAVCISSLNSNAKESNIGITGEKTSDSLYFLYNRPEYPRDCSEVQDHCSSSNVSGVYVIKPDGYPDPFEVYCDNTASSGGWTVIQRRFDGSIDFNRAWENYKFGFGYLSAEFWLGNEKLSYLTNQRDYELLIEIGTLHDHSYNVTYSNFRITDAFSDYKLTRLTDYSSATGITWCPENMIYGNCTCQSTCEDPGTCQDHCTEDEACICPEGYLLDGNDCIAKSQCGCFVSDIQRVVPEGEFTVHSGCTRRGVCTNRQVNWNEGYHCDVNAVCDERNDVLQCYCNEGFAGDGVTCTTTRTDCQDWYDGGSRDNGIYTIKPTTWQMSQFDVYCNMTDDGGWTVFQRRVDGSVDFSLDWNMYKQGFGNISHEFWLGNDKLHHLTKQKIYQMRIDMITSGGSYYAMYDFFRISGKNDNYLLSIIGSYSGTMDIFVTTTPAPTTISQWNCDNINVFTDPARNEVTSPNWPSTYDNDARSCSTIRAPPGRTIRLTFTAFQLEYGHRCGGGYWGSSSIDYFWDYAYVSDFASYGTGLCGDGLHVYDGSSTSDTKLMFGCGDGLPPPVTSTGNTMYLFFYSNGYTQCDGFRATFQFL